MRDKKTDLFSWVVIAVATIAIVLLELTFLSGLFGKFSWELFLERNGTALSMFGALWTALGVRMSPNEFSALQKLRKNNFVIIGEIIHTLRIASRFATVGAWLILLGSTFLCVKVWFFR
ncbi:MAG: hypothetical protein WDA33_12870 [Alcaligenes sp.]